MSRLLLVVHGMGLQPPGWGQAVRDKLDEVACRYAAFRNGAVPFSERVTIAEVRYDGIFEDIVEGWQQQAEELKAFAVAQGRPLPKIIQWLETPLPQDDAAAKSFFWSTAIDPLLYRGFALVRDRVRATVMAQVAQKLTHAMGSGSVQASVLAHSLGTAVMHDTLHKLGSAPYEGNESFLAARWKFTNVFTVANVSVLGPRALRDIDPHGSIVRPSYPAAPASATYCQSFFNVWHRWDPFVLCGPFRPDGWGAEYREVGPLDHFHQGNVHGFTHYLDHPIVHARVINHTLGYDAITVPEYRAAVANYPQFDSPQCTKELAELRRKALELDGINNDFEEIITKVAEYYAVARRVGETCPGLVNED
jgi:hypothetical protein